MEDRVLNQRILETEQARDEVVGWMISCMKTCVKPTWQEVAFRSTESKAYWGNWESLRLRASGLVMSGEAST